jgi:hypothetical protein
MNPTTWVRVRRGAPCPVCGRDGWCAVAADGTAALCMREAEGSTKQVDCGGAGAGWLHRLGADRPAPMPAPKLSRSVVPTFTAGDAQRTWGAALARALDDDAAIDEDRAAWLYLAERGLAAAYCHKGVGVLHEAMEADLPAAVRSWARRGYRVVVPLFDQRGELVSVQARHIAGRNPKTIFPCGPLPDGAVFANRAGVALLRGEWSGERAVIVGEGLTDSLALSLSTELPVLCVPGVGGAPRIFGLWCFDLDVALALDCDPASEQKIPEASRAAFAAGAARVLRVTWPTRCKDACDVVARVGTNGLAKLLAAVVQQGGAGA